MNDSIKLAQIKELQATLKGELRLMKNLKASANQLSYPAAVQKALASEARVVRLATMIADLEVELTNPRTYLLGV